MINISKIEQTYCPFWDSHSGSCQVSFSREAIGSKRCLHYCLSDDHDNCPLYLAEALRRSRMKSSALEPIQHIQG